MEVVGSVAKVTLQDVSPHFSKITIFIIIKSYFTKTIKRKQVNSLSCNYDNSYSYY